MQISLCSNCLALSPLFSFSLQLPPVLTLLFCSFCAPLFTSRCFPMTSQNRPAAAKNFALLLHLVSCCCCVWERAARASDGPQCWAVCDFMWVYIVLMSKRVATTLHPSSSATSLGANIDVCSFNMHANCCPLLRIIFM